MRQRDVELVTLQACVDRRLDQFRTLDVASDDVFRAVHADFLQDRNFNADVGRALSVNRDVLRIDLLSTSGGNATWGKQRGVARKDLQRSSETGAAELGPQYPGDPPFRAQMRRHQSWYRATRLRVPPGTGPTSSSATHYGNMLTADDAERGANFLTPAIFDQVQRRISAGGGVEPFRCLHNTLSSQPLCFNLFGPLAGDLDLARQLLGATMPGEIGEVTSIEFEVAPAPAREYLGDRTAFDALVRYTRPGGTPAFVAIEVKLTEPFTQKAYDGPKYRTLTSSAGAPFSPERVAELADIRWNQLWRNHLLVEAVKRHPSTPQETVGRLAVVRHPRDEEARAAVDGYRRLLVDPHASFLDWPLDALVEGWRTMRLDGPSMAWLNELQLRYLDLKASVRQQ